jgi:hypothetical protein
MSGVNLSSVNFVIPKRVGLETFLMEFQKITKSIICYFPGTKEIYFVSLDDLKHGMWKKYKSNDIAGCYYYHDDENDCDITVFSSDADKKLGSIPMDKSKKPKKSNVFQSIQPPVLAPPQPPPPPQPVKQTSYYPNYPQQTQFFGSQQQIPQQQVQQQQMHTQQQMYQQPQQQMYTPPSLQQFNSQYGGQQQQPMFHAPPIQNYLPPQPQEPIHPNVLRTQQSQDMKFYNGSKTKKQGPVKLESKFVA